MSDTDTSAERLLLDRLKKMGIVAWHEPLLCLPKSFIDYSKTATIKQALPRTDVVAEPKIFTLIVIENPRVIAQPKKRIILTATDGMLIVKIVIFIEHEINAIRWKNLEEGHSIHIRGAIQNWNGLLQMVNPTLVDSKLIGTVVPVYEKRRGLVADGAIYEATRHALEHHFDDTIKYLVASFHGISEADILCRTKLKAPSIATILRAAHEPSTEDEGHRGLIAMRRLAALSIVENANQMKQPGTSVGEVHAANQYSTPA